MSPFPNLRSRLQAAFREHAEEWRPGGTAPEAPMRRRDDAAFVAAPEPAAEPAPRRASEAWSAPAPLGPREEPAEGSRASLLARLRSPDALREAFVVKEILDRPVGLRPLRGRGIRN